jgi:hypothetical protein
VLVRSGTGDRGSGEGPAKALFFVEYGLGHKTHLPLPRAGTWRAIRRFDETIIPLYWLDRVGDLLGKLQIPPLRERGLDFFTWWVFQFKRQQVGYLLRRFDPRQLDLVYIHTQTAATSVLDLPKSVPAVVSIDLTWKLAFQESRYISSPLFRPTLELERRIFERSDLVVSFSDWAAASVIDDYGIPASKVRVVRNGVTLPPPAGEGAEPALVGAGVEAASALGRRAGGGDAGGTPTAAAPAPAPAGHSARSARISSSATPTVTATATATATGMATAPSAGARTDSATATGTATGTESVTTRTWTRIPTCCGWGSSATASPARGGICCCGSTRSTSPTGRT